jgi:hypothetical protein
MQRKLLVALQLKVVHRFIERLASGRAKRVKDPGAFGATPTAQTWLFNPYQLPTHGCPCRRAHRGLTPGVVRSPNLGAAEDALISWRSLHVSIRMVCSASYIRTKGCSPRTPDFRASLSVTHSSGKANVGYPTEACVCGNPVYFSGSSANKQGCCFPDAGPVFACDPNFFKD